MMEGGEPERVLELRRNFQRVMKDRYRDLIEELTGVGEWPLDGAGHLAASPGEELDLDELLRELQ